LRSLILKIFFTFLQCNSLLTPPISTPAPAAKTEPTPSKRRRVRFLESSSYVPADHHRPVKLSPVLPALPSTPPSVDLDNNLDKRANTVQHLYCMQSFLFHNFFCRNRLLYADVVVSAVVAEVLEVVVAAIAVAAVVMMELHHATGP
jgi:hypothetical protein